MSLGSEIKRKGKKEQNEGKVANNWSRAVDALIIVIRQQCDHPRKMYDQGERVPCILISGAYINFGESRPFWRLPSRERTNERANDQVCACAASLRVRT